ncbi:MAG: glycosyltransferase family 4 protein [Oscillospiraceae bacterium]|nr:glycosyltransferase family 4 protein [Oscillospiraceae bacterium]
MINHFPLVGSGSGTYTRNIAVHLMKKDHDVSIVMPENTSNFATIPHVSVYPVFFSYDQEMACALPFNFPCFTTHPRSTMTFFDLSADELEAYLGAFEKAINKAVEEFRPDVIHAQHVWLLSWLAGKTGIPTVITAHGTDLMGYQQGPRFRKYAQEAAAMAKSIITISNDNDRLVREIFPSCANKATFMRNGYDPCRFYPDPKTHEEIRKLFDISIPDKLVFFAGKLAHFKGIDVLINAARLYEGEHPGKILTIIAGDGELSGELKKQAEDLRLKNVIFLGHLDISQLRALYSTADVSVVPSRREPFGLVAIEALACGSPVIATNQGGLPDIINSDVGALVEVDDPFGLSSAILNELYRPDQAARKTAAAQYAAANYTQESLMDQLIEIFTSAQLSEQSNEQPSERSVQKNEKSSPNPNILVTPQIRGLAGRGCGI